MRFLYTTDLHGDTSKYENVLGLARKLDIKLIHLGADLLPKGSRILKAQKSFVKGYLKAYHEWANSFGIKVLAFFGNDDIPTRKEHYRKYAQLLDEDPYFDEGFTFTAYGYVPDYPFGLKCACKLDTRGWRCPEPYLGRPVIATQKGFEPIEDIDRFFAKRTTIEEDLQDFPGGSGVIAAVHCPPYGLGLDVCPSTDFDADPSDIRKVGSAAILHWIETEQPRLVLCGHIHESPRISGVWKAQIDDTVIVQPGQEHTDTVAVAIDITKDTLEMERFVVPPGSYD